MYDCWKWNVTILGKTKYINLWMRSRLFKDIISGFIFHYKICKNCIGSGTKLFIVPIRGYHLPELAHTLQIDKVLIWFQ